MTPFPTDKADRLCLLPLCVFCVTIVILHTFELYFIEPSVAQTILTDFRILYLFMSHVWCSVAQMALEASVGHISVFQCYLIINAFSLFQEKCAVIITFGHYDGSNYQ